MIRLMKISLLIIGIMGFILFSYQDDQNDSATVPDIDGGILSG